MNETLFIIPAERRGGSNTYISVTAQLSKITSSIQEGKKCSRQASRNPRSTAQTLTHTCKASKFPNVTYSCISEQHLSLSTDVHLLEDCSVLLSLLWKQKQSVYLNAAQAKTTNILDNNANEQIGMQKRNSNNKKRDNLCCFTETVWYLKWNDCTGVRATCSCSCVDPHELVMC